MHGQTVFAYGEATVPKVTVITKRSMAAPATSGVSKHLVGRFQLCLAHGGNRGDGRQGRGRDPVCAAIWLTRKRSLPIPATMKSASANPFVAAEKGFIDEVIQPHSTRRRVARALASLRSKRQSNPEKHDNIPL